jgi:hypothetical protein
MSGIHPDILRPRVPRLGTVTTGYGVEATSRRGGTYSKPTRSDTLVFHTNDEEVAEAVRAAYGGHISKHSPTWEFDVITDQRSIAVTALATGFRQALEDWRAAECLRRCDGVTMSTVEGKPNVRPCMCNLEMERGEERRCTPTTILPVLLEAVKADRLGIWELRSNSWGTAAAFAGTLQALQMTGVSAPSFPAIVQMVDRTVRDVSGELREVVELQLTVAASHHQLAELASRASELPAGPAELEDPRDLEHRAALMDSWANVQRRAHQAGLRDRLADDWRTMFGSGKRFEDLTVGELEAWVELADATVADAESPQEPAEPPAEGDLHGEPSPPLPVEQG